MVDRLPQFVFFLQLFWLLRVQLFLQGHRPHLRQPRRRRLKRQTQTLPTAVYHIHACVAVETGDLWLPFRSLQEFQRKIAKLQAEFSAEQESKAKLQEDLASLRLSYESELWSLKAQARRGSSTSSKRNNRLRCAAVHSSFCFGGKYRCSFVS